MRIPKRKSEEDARKLKDPRDNYLTPDAIKRMEKKLKKLKGTEQKIAIKEVQRTQEMGDLSENAAYQDAKWRLRRINNQILSLTERIQDAIPIKATNSNFVHIGSNVTIKTDKDKQTYQIVGTCESNPMQGRISHSSPLGQMLIGKKIDDEVVVAETTYRIIKIQ